MAIRTGGSQINSPSSPSSKRAWLLQLEAAEQLPCIRRRLPERRCEQAYKEQEEPGRGDGKVSLRNVVSISICTHDTTVGSAPSDGADELIKNLESPPLAALRHFGTPSVVPRLEARVNSIQAEIVDLTQFLLSGRHTSGDVAMGSLVGSGVDACPGNGRYRPIRNAERVRVVVDRKFSDAFASMECSELNECRVFQCGFRKQSLLHWQPPFVFRKDRIASKHCLYGWTALDEGERGTPTPWNSSVERNAETSARVHYIDAQSSLLLQCSTAAAAGSQRVLCMPPVPRMLSVRRPKISIACR